MLFQVKKEYYCKGGNHMKRQISLILVLLFALAALPLGVLAAGNDYRYATEPVNMRTGPGTQYDVIRELQTPCLRPKVP